VSYTQTTLKSTSKLSGDVFKAELEDEVPDEVEVDSCRKVNQSCREHRPLVTRKCCCSLPGFTHSSNRGCNPVTGHGRDHMLTSTSWCLAHEERGNFDRYY
jgi:hypothetical protein